MLLQLFAEFLAIGALFLPVGHRRRRAWAFLVLLLTLAAAAAFSTGSGAVLSADAEYEWLSFQSLRAFFYITSDPAIVKATQYVLAAMLVLMLLNLLNPREEYALAADNIVLLLGCAFIFLASAQDFMQLMTASCCYSIFGFALINNTDAKNRFIFYAFASEMAIFAALAVVYAKTGSIALADLPEFARRGWHKDLTALLILFGVLSKCGMFLFQNQFMALRNLSINRLLTGAWLAAPLSGLVLYNKLHVVCEASEYSLPILRVLAVLAIGWAAVGLVRHCQFQAKLLYLAAMAFAVALLWLALYPDAIYEQVVKWLPSAVFLEAVAWALWMRRCSGIAEPTAVEPRDNMSAIYETLFVEPLRFVGRVLWLAVDFVVIERSLLGTMSTLVRLVVSGLQKIQSASWPAFGLLAAVALGMLIYNIGGFVYG